MTKMRMLAAVALIGILSMSGCTKTQKGAAIGAGSGALIGALAGGKKGAAIGAGVGAIAGGVIGHKTKDKD